MLRIQRRIAAYRTESWVNAREQEETNSRQSSQYTLYAINVSMKI